MRLTQNLPTDGLDSTWIRRLTSGDSTPPSHRGIGASGATLGILVLWWIVSAIGIWSEIILPSPGQVWDAFVESVTSDGARRGLSDHLLWEHLVTWTLCWLTLSGRWFVDGPPGLGDFGGGQVGQTGVWCRRRSKTGQ